MHSRFIRPTLANSSSLFPTLRRRRHRHRRRPLPFPSSPRSGRRSARRGRGSPGGAARLDEDEARRRRAPPVELRDGTGEPGGAARRGSGEPEEAAAREDEISGRVSDRTTLTSFSFPRAPSFASGPPIAASRRPAPLRLARLAPPATALERLRPARRPARLGVTTSTKSRREAFAQRLGGLGARLGDHWRKPSPYVIWMLFGTSSRSITLTLIIIRARLLRSFSQTSNLPKLFIAS